MEKSIDLYFDENYGKLYEKIENGKAEIFEFENEDGKITNQFLIREIPEKVNGKTYYDIVTPYGYGGPIINYLKGNKENLLKEFEKNFKKYAEERNIVSEFVRFHPIKENAIDMKPIYNSTYMRKTLGTNLEKFENPVQSEFSKSCRKTIRQALKQEITYKVTEKPENLEEFKKIYYLTMDRKNATDYYYFGDEYFENIKKYYKNNIILVEAIFKEKTIASGLYFIYNGIIHVHLSGTNTKYLHLSPAYILKYGTAIWGKEHGYKLIHYGGGLSNSEEDSLYLFKRKFAQNTDFDFYIGKKVWNKEIYDKLCKQKNIIDDGGFFPAYRKS